MIGTIIRQGKFGHRVTQKELREEDYRKMEAESEVMLMQPKECQGLLAPPTKRKRQ
jgi:hypothetical protein